jgi:hypothetical protein
MRDLIILCAYLLIVTGLIQWMIYYSWKSIEAFKNAKEAYKKYKKSEQDLKDFINQNKEKKNENTTD